MNSIRLLVVLCGSALLSLGLLAQGTSQASSQAVGEGLFILSFSESNLGNAPKPQSEVINMIANTPSTLAFTVDIVLADGSKLHESWQGAPDGVLRPLKNARGGEQDSLRRVGDDLVADNVLDDGTKLHEEVRFSKDGNTMTIAKVIHSAKGDSPMITAVFHKGR